MRRPKVEKGSVLVLAVWTLLMLAIFAASVGFSVRNLIDATRRFEIRSDLRHIAKSGVEKALAILEQDQKRENFSDHSGEPWSVNEGEFKEISLGRGTFSVRHKAGDVITYGLVDEQSRININQVDDAQILIRLLGSAADVGPQIAEEIAEAILDWKDPDDQKREKGAESDYYRTMKPPYAAPNRSFVVLDELLFVRGVTYEIFDDIQPYLTLKTDGKINLNTAPKPVLIALGLEPVLVEKILRYRGGLDQLECTVDDNFFESLEGVVEKLRAAGGISESEEEYLSELLAENKFTVSSTLFSVELEGRMRGRKDSILVRALINKEGRILSWHEMFQAL